MMELVLNWAERDMIVIGSRREMCAWAGTSQLLQCEGGHWSGEAAPSHQLELNQSRGGESHTWRGPGPRTCTPRTEEY